MVKTILHKADTRGHAMHGWLDTHHTFSFADYHDPQRIHFGALRVLNDDIVSPGRGFGQHPHQNMEIISIPLQGDLEHKDDMGNIQIIRHGDIQVMSAGTGIYHSEYNKNNDLPVKFLQIWIIPNRENVKPRYDQLTMNISERYNKFQQIVSAYPADKGLWIYQDASLSLGRFDKLFKCEYKIKGNANGIYAFVIEGSLTIENQLLNKRDGLGIWDINKITITSERDDAELLLIEVPMEW
jgi:redox-sensitive bicupin YhaK (pirin superfamily)